MPLLENDTIFAYLNEYDPNHKIAEKIFQKLQKALKEYMERHRKRKEWHFYFADIR